MAVYKPKYRDKETGELKESPFWWIDFTIGDKRIRESSETTRKTIATEYEKRRRHEMERANAGLPTEEPSRRISTVAEFIKKYLEHYPDSHRPKSVLFSKQRLANVKRLLGGVLLPDLTEDRLRDYIQARLAEPRTSGRTINMELGELSRALKNKWSVLWPKVRKLEENHDIGQALSPDEEKNLLTAAAGNESPNRNPVLYPFLCLALTTGMRSSEIAQLVWSSVDMDRGILTVPRSKTKAGARQIPFNEDLKTILIEHRRWVERKVGGPVQSTWHVFPGRTGRPHKGHQRPLDPTIHIGDISTAWDSLRETTGVQCRFHDLRHTVATKMAEAGVPESTMLSIMGHMSRAMLERYSHIRMLAKREAVKSLELPKRGPELVNVKGASKQAV